MNNLFPARPIMPKVSRELHNSGKYNACLIKNGIVIQRHGTGTGILLSTSHSQFSEYLNAFDDSMDSQERDLLCKALAY